MTCEPASIAAVVVLYHPTLETVANIRSWLGQVDRLVAVDNSEGELSPVGEAVAALGDKVTLLHSGVNEGIARALNTGAEWATAAGYDYLLTMDQDSRAEAELVVKLADCLSRRDNVGLVSPFHCTRSSGAPPADGGCRQVMTPMTSGCLMSLAAYRAVGPFRDDFFIDFVDNEYCLRLRRAGYDVVRAGNALLQHSVGDTRTYGPFVATNHSSLRRYYKTRNRLWVFTRYVRTFPGHCLFDLVRLTKEIASIVLFEGDKCAKLKMMWRGGLDFCEGRMGKFGESGR